MLGFNEELIFISNYESIRKNERCEMREMRSYNLLRIWLKKIIIYFFNKNNSKINNIK